MKESELRQHLTCNHCGGKILASGIPLFWVLKVERYGVDLRACRQQDGLAGMIGSTAIAQVMGPDHDLASPVMEPVTLTLCEPCALSPNTAPIGAISLEPQREPPKLSPGAAWPFPPRRS